MKKIVVFILACGLIMMNMMSCSDVNNNSENTESAEITAESAEITDTLTEAETQASNKTDNYLDQLGERDFKGETFVIYASEYAQKWGSVPVEDDLNGEIINDSIYLRDNFISEKYNIKIEYNTEIDDNTGTFQKAVMSQDDICDMVVNSSISFSTQARKGILYNLKQCDYIKFDAEWWSTKINKGLDFNNSLYFMTGDIMPSVYAAPACMYFNMNLFESYGYSTDEIYKTVNDGKWTLDVLGSYIKDKDADLNNDGQMSYLDDFYGLDTSNNAKSWAIGAGLKLSEQKNGEIVIDLNNEHAVAVTDKLKSLISDRIIDFNLSHDDFIDVTFKQDHALFLMHYLQSAVYNLRDMESDYGILPMPKYDENQDSYNSAINIYMPCFVGIAPNESDIDRSAFIMEAMANQSYKMIRPNMYETVLKNKIARNEESQKIIDTIIDNLYMDINYLYNFGKSIDMLSNVIDKNQPHTSSFEKIERFINKDMENFAKEINKNLESSDQ